MEDIQDASTHWGITPILFHIGKYSISSYSVFVILAIIIASIVYFYEARKYKQVNEYSFLIAFGAFLGSSLGAKLLEITINAEYINLKNGLILFLYSGRTVIGGLIGGTVGVWITKKIIGLKEKRGNLFAPAIAIGLAIGRIGCFLNGCCYGSPSSLPWAVDFGDGIPRHPTQLYESMFMFILFFILQFGIDESKALPGYLFKLLMIIYFIFRFLIEFIRVEKQAIIGLTYFQIISAFVLIYLILSDKQQFLKQLLEYGKSRTRKG
jgi:prolipoprotein diacylglyceryl transferase